MARIVSLSTVRHAALLVVLALPALASAEVLDPEDVRRGWRSRLDGKHFSASIRLVLGEGGEEGERRLRVWRDDEGGHRERLLARFYEPFDLRGVSVLYIEQEGRPNDYFLYQPSAKRIRRVPEGLTREDLYGIDLEFLGFDVAGGEPTAVESLDRVQLDGRGTLKLVETAAAENPRFEQRTVWLDAETFLPMRSEYRIDGAVTVIAHTLEVSDVQGVPTPMHIRFVRPLEEHTVDLLIDEIDYERPIESSFFSTIELTKRSLRYTR